MAETYREIEITGSLLDRFVPKGGTYGAGGHCTVTRCTTVDADVIRRIDAAQADGARTLLLVVDSFGGEIASAFIVAHRVRRFREEGGRVVAFVRIADSSAPLVAISADHVVLAPDGRFTIHGAGRPGDDVRDEHEVMAAALAARTGIDAWLLRGIMDEGPTRPCLIAGYDALRWGFADEIGTLERARELAAGAPLPETNRSRRIASAQAAPATLTVTAPVTMSSESSFKGSPFVSPVIRQHVMAARNFSAATIPAGTYHGAARNASASRIVAVGNSVCATSDTNGATWVARTIPAGNWRAVTWVPWLSLFVAVGQSGLCATSPTGETWTARTIGSGDFYAIACSDSVIVAIGGVCRTSTNAVTWTDRTFPGGGLGCCWTGEVFVAVGNALSPCATSPTGESWTSRSIPAGVYRSVAFLGSLLCAVGGGVCATSDDHAATWTAREMPSVTVEYMGCAFSSVGVVAAVGSGACAAAADGTVWERGAIPADKSYNAVVAAEAGVFVAVGTGVATSLAV